MPCGALPVFLSLGVLAYLIALAGSFPLVSHKQAVLNKAWKQTIGQTPQEAYRSMMSRLPKTARNETAEKLEVLLRNPELGRRMGEAGRQRLEKRFSIHQMVEKIEAVYREPLP